MKRVLGIFFLQLLVISLSSGCQNRRQDESDISIGGRKSVLLDSDMVETFDDGVAFMILLGSDDLEVISKF